MNESRQKLAASLLGLAILGVLGFTARAASPVHRHEPAPALAAADRGCTLAQLTPELPAPECPTLESVATVFAPAPCVAPVQSTADSTAKTPCYLRNAVLLL